MKGFPRRYAVLDTETWTDDVAGRVPTKRLSLRLGAMVIVDPDMYGDHPGVTHGFKTQDDGWLPFKTMKKTREPFFIFAHNMGFDSRIFGLWSKLARGDHSLLPAPDSTDAARYREPLLIADDTLFIVRTFRPDGQRFVWLDTVQWFKSSLEKVGQWIGMPKKMMPDVDAPDEVWMDYCMTDVNVLHAALLRLWSYWRKHGIYDFELTPAALSRRVYRMRWEQKRIRIPDDTDVLGLDRIGYYGGFNECFRIGAVKGPIYQVDINSLYPHVMAQNPFPCEVLSHGDCEGSTEPPEDWRPDHTTAEVWISSVDRAYPVRFSDQTLYCTGDIRTVLCGPELARAWSSRDVLRIGRWVKYRCADLFAEWADYWSKARSFAKDRGDKFADTIVKQHMNSLHGKFGQQTGEWKYVGRMAIEGTFGCGQIFNKEWRKFADYRDINGERWERMREGEDKESFVPIAAWTASYGRLYMDWMIEIAEPSQVLYIATDSLLVTARGYHSLKAAGIMDTGTMGHFKTEGRFDDVNIWNVNQVDLDTLKRRSGVKKGSIEIGPGVWSTELWESCANGITSRDPDSVFIETTLLRPSLSYSRRTVLADGTTAPWSINCWNESPEAIASRRARSYLEHREQ